MVVWGAAQWIETSYRFSSRWRWGISFATAVCFAGWGLLFSPPAIGPCSARLDAESLGSFLSNSAQRGVTREVTIVVEKGKTETCRFAKDLLTAFMIGGWNPGNIKEAELIGNGVWFHASRQDSLAIEVYEQLWRTQPVRLNFVVSPPSEPWNFWVKDSWPTPIRQNTIK